MHKKINIKKFLSEKRKKSRGKYKKAIFIKNETTKTLLRTVKTSILEAEKTTAPSDEACLPRLCFERNFMMEDTL